MTLEGTRLGKYELQSEIGRGGMTVVYHGYDPALNRSALLVLSKKASHGERFRTGQA